MTARVLLTSAGNAASNNIARSLRRAGESAFIIGCNDDRFLLGSSDADKKYLVPPVGHVEWIRTLQYILDSEALQLVIPTLDVDVAALSRNRGRLVQYLFLPSTSLIKTCQDKYQLATFLHGHGIAVPATCPVKDLRSIGAIFRQLGPGRPLWCRVRTGTGSLGAIPVQTPEQTRNWIRYWSEMRGTAESSFIISEYLPGRDFGCQSLWKDGELVLIKTYERLSYLGTGSRPAEISSVAALAKTVSEPRVVETCAKAIRALDRRASGIFSVDLKENTDGVPCITEINAGRFSSATNILDLVGRHNMVDTFLRLARGERIQFGEAYDVANDWYMLRDIDAIPRVFHADDLFDTFTDAS
jgi:glutathione synthase/RimK-type ligase-like ATP-grasp enzyme